MQNDVTIELSIRGRERPHLLPRICPANISPALERVDWLRQTRAIDQDVAEEAERILVAIGGAAR